MNTARLYVIGSSCKGCHECLDLCPTGAISFSNGSARIDNGTCVMCKACISVCRFDAIRIG